MSAAIRLPVAYPAAPATPAAPAPAAGGGLNALAGNKNLLMAGGAVVVALIAFIASKRNPPAPAPDPVAVMDTSQTDLYNDLQPELENIGKQLGDLKAVPPPVPTPTPAKPPTPAPKPVPKTGWQQHTIQKGQNYQYIAALYSTTVGRLFMSNIKGKTRADGTPGVLTSYLDFKPGVRLVIPRAIMGQLK